MTLIDTVHLMSGRWNISPRVLLAYLLATLGPALDTSHLAVDAMCHLASAAEFLRQIRRREQSDDDLMTLQIALPMSSTHPQVLESADAVLAGVTVLPSPVVVPPVAPSQDKIALAYLAHDVADALTKEVDAIAASLGALRAAIDTLKRHAPTA